MDHRTQFLAAAFADFPPVYQAWRSPQAIRTALGEWLDGQLAWQHDQAFASRFHSACPVEGAAPGDYLQRILTAPSGARLLVGIRFCGLAWPFVDVVASSESLHPIPAVREAVHLAMEHFALFAPRAVRFLRGHQAEPIQAGDLCTQVDQALFAGGIGALAALPALPRRQKVGFSALRDTQEAAEYLQRGYEAFFAEQPDMRSRIAPSDRDLLEECTKTGCLGYGMVDGEPVGVIGAARRSSYGLHGFEVIEEFIDGPWRGCGLGAALQRAMIHHMAAQHSDEVLFGTIDDKNAASMATARHAGRTRIADYLFISPAP